MVLIGEYSVSWEKMNVMVLYLYSLIISDDLLEVIVCKLNCEKELVLE